jgi:hypothetical protein
MPPAGAQPRKPNAPSAANKEANEYIPSFISKKPFYIGDDDDQNDYLEHQRLQKAQNGTIEERSLALQRQSSAKGLVRTVVP